MIPAGVRGGHLLDDWSTAISYATWLAHTTGRRHRVKKCWGTHWHVTEIHSPMSPPAAVPPVAAVGGNRVPGRRQSVGHPYLRAVA